MQKENWLQKYPWAYGLLWAWTLFAALTFIDHWNGELDTSRLYIRFAAWTVAGIGLGYWRRYLYNKTMKKNEN